MEIALTYTESNNGLLFSTDGDMVFGDYSGHDKYPLPMINAITAVVENGETGFVLIPLTSGHEFKFFCTQSPAEGAPPLEVQAVTSVFGEPVVGASPYECAEFVAERIWKKLNWII